MNSINSEFGTNISIDKLKLSLFFWDVSIKGVYIEDYKKDTLFYVKELTTSISSARDLVKGELKFDAIELKGLVFDLTTYKNEKVSNLDVFVEKLDSGKKRDPNTPPFLLTADNVSVVDGVFKLQDFNTETKTILDFKKLNGATSDLLILGPKVSLIVDEMTFVTQHGLTVNNMTTKFAYSKEQMRFENLSLQTDKSFLEGELFFSYERKDLKDFFDKVQIVGQFTDSKVALDDVNLFYNEFGKNKEVVISTQLSGTLNNLSCTKLFLECDKTGGRGNFTFKNLFSKQESFLMEADLRGITTDYFQLRSLMPNVLGKSVPKSFQKLGSFRVSGPAKVSESVVNAQLNLVTSIGNGFLDLLIKDYNNSAKASYKGFVSLLNFDLGNFINQDNMGRATMDINVEGVGFEKQTLNTEIIGKIYSFEFNGYDYKDVAVSGILKEQLFDGSLNSNDPNFKFDFSGLADFTESKNNFNFIANVDYANLYALNFINDSISEFKGDINMEVTGNTLDNLVGAVSFSKTNYKNPKDTYYFEDFKVTSLFESDSIRIISINSPDIVNGYLKGKYKIRELGKMVQNSIGSIYTNYTPYEVSQGQNIAFNFKINNKIVGVFFPKLKFGSDTSLKGNIIADEGDVKLSFKSTRVNILGNQLDDIDIKIDNKQPLFNTFVGVGKVHTDYYNLKDFELINTTLKDTLFFRTEFKGGKNFKDTYNLNFYHTFTENNRSVIGLKTSDLSFKGNKWLLNKEGNTKNKVIFNKTLDSITIEEIVMNNNQEEQIKLRGVIADTTYKDIALEFKIVTLDKVTPDIENVKLDGVVDGSVHILQRNNVYLPSCNLFISKFGINEESMGDLSVGLVGNNDLTDFVVNAQLEENGRDTFSVFGNIYNKTSVPQAKLLVNFDDFDIAPFSALTEGVLSDMRGLLQGNAEITGDIYNPEINGLLSLNNGGLGVPILNINFDFGAYSRIGLTGKSFQFQEIKLVDTVEKTTGVLDGTISHNGFDDWILDLTIDSKDDRLMVLNTPFEEEVLYYGSGFLRGKGRIYGPPNNLKISVEGRTGEGTSLKIPLSDVQSVGDYSFINFIDKNESLIDKEDRELKEYENLELFFDLDITPDAEVEIVVDQETGSSLKGSGEGPLLIQIDSHGKFLMYGEFVVVNGSYRYKFGNIIDKPFKVRPGGNIVWEGPPLGAQLNMEAIYSLTANPAPLLDNSSITKRIDTDVVIRLTEELERPNIEFDIEFPGTGSIIKSELQYRLQDPIIRERNAIFLLAQGSFVDASSGINQQAVTGNLIQTASGMLNQMLSSNNDNFSFGVSYEQGYLDKNTDSKTDDRLGVNVTTKISDNVLFNGKFGVPVGGVSETVVAGDVEVQILLNEEGTLRAVIFNRENEVLQFIGERQGYTQGAGISYEVDFNDFKGLMRKILGPKNDKKQKKDKDPEQALNIMGKDSLITISSKEKIPK